MYSLFGLFYQVEIRHHQIPSSKISVPLTAGNARDDTTRLWQLRDCDVERFELPTAFGWATATAGNAPKLRFEGRVPNVSEG
jgi:hypothetical protein